MSDAALLRRLRNENPYDGTRQHLSSVAYDEGVVAAFEALTSEADQNAALAEEIRAALHCLDSEEITRGTIPDLHAGLATCRRLIATLGKEHPLVTGDPPS